jgi:hypothetical protein
MPTVARIEALDLGLAPILSSIALDLLRKQRLQV